MQRLKLLTDFAKNLRSIRAFSVSNKLGQNEPESMKTLTNSRLSYATTVSDYHLVSDTIGDVIRMQSESIPTKVLYGFAHQGVNMTFGELKQRVDAISQNLLRLGFKKGDRIAISLPNNYELATTFLAASQIGLVSVVLNPAYQQVEFEYMLQKTGAKGLVVYDSFKILNHIELIRKICPEIDSSEPGKIESKKLPNLKHVIVLNSPLVPEKKTYKGTWQFSEISEPKSSAQKYESPVVDIDDPCLILFTSGTTGKPKGALMTHGNLLNSAYLSTVVVGKPEGLRMLCNPIPIFHIFGLSTGLLVPLLMGSTLVFPFYFPDTLTTMKAIQGYKCNTLRGTPTQFFDLIMHPERKNLDLSSLENGVIGASTVPPDLLAKMRSELNIVDIVVGYGMTETSLCHSVTTFSDAVKSAKWAYESCGRPLPFTESKIVDPVTGNIVPLNSDGELYVRGPLVIKEYWDEKEKTEETFDRGWLKTGDIFSMDEHGYLYFKSRQKEVIIRGGANLYPAEVESFLRTHPSIADAQVFSVPDERLGEEICTWVKLKPDGKLNEAELKEFCKGKISHFKIPRYVKFVDSFPINANNKILKNVMREKAIDELNLKK